jgi:16S rRNA (guanine527-N7)-methyltransferase
MSHIVGLSLPPEVFDQLGVYLDLLLRWNARTNLTAIRDPEQIVMRHFGESLFAAGVLFASEVAAPGMSPQAERHLPSGSEFSDHRPLTTGNSTTLADLGSGAGFPGMPIKLAIPSLQVTLIESQNKKATFLKEVVRALRLEGIDVYSGRAEQWGKQADVVTLRAVEKFDLALRTAIRLVEPNGRLCLLLGNRQRDLLSNHPDLRVEVEEPMPFRHDSMLVVVKSAL